jgi:UDP-GlcNAc:undecaprenyl-phosphate GlcNAc-1-phosphate transferase
MTEYVYIAAVSFGVTLAATPLAKRAAFATGVLDRPDERLKTHKRPTPYLGGLAILSGMLISLVLANRSFGFDRVYFWAFIAVMLAMTLIGLMDDLFDIRQNYKFAVQVALASALALSGHRAGVIPAPAVSIPLTVFYIVGVCNSLNLLDGMDGLASGVTAIASFFFLLLFLERGDAFGIALSLSLLGACLGFLVYNFNPASIFMGDAGSMLLGVALPVLAVRYASVPYDFRGFAAPVLVCGVSVFDTALAFTRRYLNNRPIFPGDRSHFYDQLVDRGFSVRRTVMVSYLLGAFLGAAALITKGATQTQALILFLAVLSAFAGAVWRLRMLRIEK